MSNDLSTKISNLSIAKNVGTIGELNNSIYNLKNTVIETKVDPLLSEIQST